MLGCNDDFRVIVDIQYNNSVLLSMHAASLVKTVVIEAPSSAVTGSY